MAGDVDGDATSGGSLVLEATVTKRPTLDVTVDPTVRLSRDRTTATWSFRYRCTDAPTVRFVVEMFQDRVFEEKAGWAEGRCDGTQRRFELSVVADELWQAPAPVYANIWVRAQGHVEDVTWSDERTVHFTTLGWVDGREYRNASIGMRPGQVSALFDTAGTLERQGEEWMRRSYAAWYVDDQPYRVAIRYQKGADGRWYLREKTAYPAS
jgi:hypothetical protein